MTTNATFEELDQALAIINKKWYYGNISLFETGRISSKRVKFRLKAISGLNGSRTSHSGRNLNAASWHVHGNFFDTLFEIRDDIFILARGKKITKESGNWEDSNIGSIMSPLYFSESSIEQDDNEYFWNKINEDIEKIEAKRIRNFDAAKARLKSYAANIKRIAAIAMNEFSFAEITKLTFIETGNIKSLQSK